jgi:hypothetical protein
MSTPIFTPKPGNAGEKTVADLVQNIMKPPATPATPAQKPPFPGTA